MHTEDAMLCTVACYASIVYVVDAHSGTQSSSKLWRAALCSAAGIASIVCVQLGWYDIILKTLSFVMHAYLPAFLNKNCTCFSYLHHFHDCNHSDKLCIPVVFISVLQEHVYRMLGMRRKKGP